MPWSNVAAGDHIPPPTRLVCQGDYIGLVINFIDIRYPD